MPTAPYFTTSKTMRSKLCLASCPLGSGNTAAKFRDDPNRTGACGGGHSASAFAICAPS
ncbi:hypothetical protein K456DRAFT_44510 [Colletotrichum gloeosporioides 23]|nr:hypothetical protein K456DRAFT_44510 [Colletotrichum gloeosporioides 23]